MEGHHINTGLQPIQGGRKFYEIPVQNFEQDIESKQCKPQQQNDPAEFAKYVNLNIIGNQTTFMTPFGRRRIIYCDHVASGKSVAFIEDYLR